MTKVIKPNKEFYESEKKPDYLVLSKSKNGSKDVVKFKRPKIKSRINKKFLSK